MFTKIRKPVCAGSWYSDDPEELSSQISSYLKTVPNFELNIKAIIVPHAGYMFSGQTAAYAFKQLPKNIEEVIILGTAHRYPLKGACVINYDFYDSPFGKIKLSEKTKDFLREEGVVSIQEADRDEHSIEIEIPFIQKVLSNPEILPIIVGKTNPDEFSFLLEKYIDDKTAIVVSVDLSHFHSYNEAVELDKYSINSILELDDEKIKNAEIDSPWAVMSVIKLAKRKGWKTKLLDYKNSGDIIKDKSSVVGYGAIAFFEEAEKKIFSEKEKQLMVQIAKDTVEYYVKHGKKFVPQDIPKSFKKRYACFVTLKKNGELRGCIGTLEPTGTLIEGIIDNAISAATRDNRFEPVRENELKDLEYEVSVLSEPKQIFPSSAFELLEKIEGKGVIIEKGFRRAVYLPQVWEHFSKGKTTRTEDFLTSLCRKGGLSGGEWKDYKSMSFYIFTLED